MSSKAYQEVYPLMTEKQKDIMYDLCMKAVSHDGHIWNMYCDIEDTVAGIVKEQMPPAQPERKKGGWLRYGEDGYPNNEDTVFWQCDQCLEQYTGRTKRIPNFCPNCGADMRKENES